jgi:glycosyltransferase involved in cell wall biosynthesis
MSTTRSYETSPVSHGEAPALLLEGVRVVFVLAGEVLGGAEQSLLAVASDLRNEHGAEVAVVALDDRPGAARSMAQELGIRWHAYPTAWPSGRLRRRRTLASFARAVRRLHPDLLVAATNLPNVLTALTWRGTGARVAVWNQADVSGSRRFSDELVRSALDRTPLVVTWAEHGRRWLAERFGLDSARVAVIHQKVELPAPRESRSSWRHRLGVRDDDVVASMLAHFHAGKDHETVVRAWAKVVEAGSPDGHRPVLVLAGRDAGSLDATRALANELAVAADVRFVGEVDDVAGLLGASDLAVFASPRELLPRGVLEPMASGLPVVASDIPGVREAVGAPGEELLVPSGDAAAFAASTLRIVRDPVLRRQVGAASAELVQARNSRAATTAVYAVLLERALGTTR